MRNAGTYDRRMANTVQSFSLSVRAEAQRTTAPDQVDVAATLSAAAGSKSDAMSEVHTALSAMLDELTALGGEVLTASSLRAPLTWSTQSVQTHQEHTHDKTTGAHSPTGRHIASVSLRLTVRDFALIADATATLSRRDSIEVESVIWSVDDDNAEWAVVRADAISAALRKGRDYAHALGGTVVSIDHVADAGLLGGDNSGGLYRRSVNFGAPLAAAGHIPSLDPVPQTVNATIEARFTATAGALPEVDLQGRTRRT